MIVGFGRMDAWKHHETAARVYRIGNRCHSCTDLIRARLDQCSVRAPVSGVVIDVVSNPGQFMSLAVPTPLLHLAPDGSLQVRAEVDSRDVQRICAAQPATVTVDGLTTPPIHAQVASINPVASVSSFARASVTSGAGHGGRFVCRIRRRATSPIGAWAITAKPFSSKFRRHQRG
jgi:multidrug resistance efflux pump